MSDNSKNDGLEFFYYMVTILLLAFLFSGDPDLFHVLHQKAMTWAQQQ